MSRHDAVSLRREVPVREPNAFEFAPLKFTGDASAVMFKERPEGIELTLRQLNGKRSRRRTADRGERHREPDDFVDSGGIPRRGVADELHESRLRCLPCPKVKPDDPEIDNGTWLHAWRMNIHPERGRSGETAQDPVHEPPLTHSEDRFANPVERSQMVAVDVLTRE